MPLELVNLSRVFGHEIALNDVSAFVAEGSATALLGANGAGKSTLLKLLAGQLSATVGHVRLDGELIRPTRTRVRKRLMLLGEGVSGVGQVIADYGVDREGLAAEAADWFERLHLVGTYTKAAKDLSKGQKYKISMVGLFLVRPKLWLLDEPYSSGLDANGLSILNESIALHRERGGIVVFSSQWPHQAMKLADQVMVLHKSRLVWHESVGTKPSVEIIDRADAPLQAVLQEIDTFRRLPNSQARDANGAGFGGGD